MQAIIDALTDMAKRFHGTHDFSAVEDVYLNAQYPVLPKQVLSPRRALFGHTRTVPFEQSAGKICAEIVTFYPPGIPLLCPGEMISTDMIEYCRRLQGAGLHISGPEDYTLATIKVVE